MDKVQKNAFTDYNAPSSEPYRLHLKFPTFQKLQSLSIQFSSHWKSRNTSEWKLNTLAGGWKLDNVRKRQNQDYSCQNEIHESSEIHLDEL
jgi:hypothetical protein